MDLILTKDVRAKIFCFKPFKYCGHQRFLEILLIKRAPLNLIWIQTHDLRIKIPLPEPALEVVPYQLLQQKVGSCPDWGWPPWSGSGWGSAGARWGWPTTSAGSRVAWDRKPACRWVTTATTSAVATGRCSPPPPPGSGTRASTPGSWSERSRPGTGPTGTRPSRARPSGSRAASSALETTLVALMTTTTTMKW